MKDKLYGHGAAMGKFLAVAQFAGVDLDVPPFTEGTTNKTPWYLKMSPAGSFPLLQTAAGGALTDHTAICMHLAGQKDALYAAQGADARSQVRMRARLPRYGQRMSMHHAMCA